MKIKIIKTICCILTSGTVMLAGISANAAEKVINPITDQPDNICGKVNIITTTDRNTYVKIYKRTPEFPSEGYLVYDTIIQTNDVHVSDTFVCNLEYNNFNYESGKYEGDYIVKIGIPTHNSSDPVYYTDTIMIEDSDYTQRTTQCTYKITLTDEELEKPLSTVSGETNNKIVDLTFSAIDFIRGDANCDGKISALDAAFIAKLLAEQKGNELPSHADFNKDGKITALDAASIAKYLAEQGMSK